MHKVLWSLMYINLTHKKKINQMNLEKKEKQKAHKTNTHDRCGAAGSGLFYERMRITQWKNEGVTMEKKKKNNFCFKCLQYNPANL